MSSKDRHKATNMAPTEKKRLDILSNNKLCGSLNINEIKDYKLESKLHILASNLLTQSIYLLSEMDVRLIVNSCPWKKTFEKKYLKKNIEKYF